MVYVGCIQRSMVAMLNMNNMEKKYYTPTIEEFHVGFEYEEYVEKYKVLAEPKQEGTNYSYPVEKLESIWEPKVYKQDDFLWVSSYDGGDYEFNEIDPNETRVKYLDKEDVESVLKELGYEIGDEHCTGGWSQSYLDGLEWYIEGFNNKTGHDLFIFKDEEKRLISIEDDETFIFIGTIKNKSELKILLKQLGISE